MNAKLVFRVESLLECSFIQQFKFSKKVRKNVPNDKGEFTYLLFTLQFNNQIAS